MLVLSRKVEEQIRIGSSVVVTVLAARNRTVKIGIKAPPGVALFREELVGQHGTALEVEGDPPRRLPTPIQGPNPGLEIMHMCESQCHASSPNGEIAVVIPALNEEQSIPLVLGALPSAWVDAVLVVDNGSSDRTAQVARANGATVVSEPRRGYGSACLRGLAELAGRPGGPPDVVVFLDADYSDHPGELPLLVLPILDGDFDLVLGSRLSGCRDPGAMPPQSVWGNRLACYLMRRLLGAHYTDLGPFRAIRWEALERLGMADRDFGWTIEMQIKAARQGLRVREVPVSYRRRVGTSKISGTVRGTILAGSKILLTIARYGWPPESPRSGTALGDGRDHNHAKAGETDPP